MGYRSGLAAGAATLLLATAGWPHFVVAQDGKQFEPLKAGSGRFEIIAGGSATPPPSGCFAADCSGATCLAKGCLAKGRPTEG